MDASRTPPLVRRVVRAPDAPNRPTRTIKRRMVNEDSPPLNMCIHKRLCNVYITTLKDTCVTEQISNLTTRIQKFALVELD